MQRNSLHFFENFKTQCVLLRFMKLKLLWEILSIYDLRLEVKMNQNMIKEPTFGPDCRFLTCLLTLSLRTTHISDFPAQLSSSHFLVTSCCFKKLGLKYFTSALNFK